MRKEKNCCEEVVSEKRRDIYNASQSMTEEQLDCVCYKSKLLNKYFDSYDDMVKAEYEYNKAHEAEIKAKEERKAEADRVKAAIKARVEAEIEAKKLKSEAYKAYLEACDKADKVVAEAKKVENEKLSEFCKKHPEGFHDTIQIGDVTYNCDYSINTNYIDPFIRLLNWF